MNNHISKRIFEFMTYKGMNANSFARTLGYSSSEKIGRLFRNNYESQPSYDIIYDITNMFEDLNAEWLIKGTGEMLKNVHQDVHQDVHFAPNIKKYNTVEEPPGIRPHNCPECAKKDTTIQHLQKQVEKLTNIIEKLTDNLDSEQKRKVS